MTIPGEWQDWEEPPEPPTPLALRVAGHAISTLAGLAAIPAAVMPFTSLFFFDAPGSGSNPYVWMLVAWAWAAPLVGALAWVKGRKAARTASWSTLWLTLAMLIAYGACLAGIALLLEQFCDGNFACGRHPGPFG
jgi:chromate transport protein ChrA